MTKQNLVKRFTRNEQDNLNVGVIEFPDGLDDLEAINGEFEKQRKVGKKERMK